MIDDGAATGDPVAQSRHLHFKTPSGRLLIGGQDGFLAEDLAMALGRMGVADREQGAGGINRHIERGRLPGVQAGPWRENALATA
jgi:hypothetical protein